MKRRKFKQPNYSAPDRDNLSTGVMVLVLIFLGWVMVAIALNLSGCTKKPKPSAASAAFNRMPESFFEKKEAEVALTDSTSNQIIIISE